MTQSQSNKIKDSISTYLTPILISIVGTMVIQEIKELKQYNIDRDQWVLEWVTENQGAVEWAKKEMLK